MVDEAEKNATHKDKALTWLAMCLHSDGTDSMSRKGMVRRAIEEIQLIKDVEIV